MSVKRMAFGQMIPKQIGANTKLTIGGTVTHSSTAFDLGLSKKYSSAIVFYHGVKAGTAGVLDVQMTVNTGPTNSLATGAATTITAKGTSLETGHAPASASEVTFMQLIDLNATAINRWIGIDILATGSASDTLTGEIFILLAGAREEPVSTLGTNVMDTT